MTHHRGDAEAAQPPVLRGWDVRASAQPPGEGRNAPLENPGLGQALAGRTYPPNPRRRVPLSNMLQPVTASQGCPEYPVANAVVVDADWHQMWMGQPHEEAVEARAWPGSAVTHAYGDEELS